MVGLFGWLRTRKSPYLYAIAIAFGLMISTKLTWMLFGGICGAFVLGALLVETRRADGLRPVLDAVRDVGLRRMGR